MKVLVKSVYDAFDYVMEHYYPFGMDDMVPLSDEYAVISIQDTHTQGFGVRFEKSHACKDVLTLMFDDIDREVDGAVLFSVDDAKKIIEFVLENKDIETLLIHCYGGESRSRAVGAFVTGALGIEGYDYFNTGNPNMHIYDTLFEEWDKLDPEIL